MPRDYDAELSEVLATVAHIRGARSIVLRAAAREAKALRGGHESYRRLHWGREGRDTARELRTADVTTPCTELGALYAVEYITDKGDDGESIYRHELEDPLPVLAVDRRGLLLIAGGGYRVETRGIVG